jgi:hypothetical protein
MKYVFTAEIDSPHGPGETLHLISEILSTGRSRTSEAGQLPGIGNLKLEAASAASFHIEDNITGARASKDFAKLETANAVCRSLNGPASGGRYGVYFADGSRVPWDYEQNISS